MDESKLLTNLRPQLMPDEKIEAHVKGSYLVGIFTNTGPRKGILAATTHRMLFYGEGALNGRTFEAHAYAGMQTFELINQIGTEHFKWTSGGRRYDLRYAGGNTQYLAQVVRPRVGQQPPSAPGMNQVPAAPTLDQQIANLADLRDRGALTPQQYDTAVARLLA